MAKGEIVTIKFDNGAVYEGEAVNGVPNGYGKKTWPDGEWYEATWKDGKTCGHTVRHHADGDVFEGNTGEGKAEGHGVYRYANGDVFEGEYKNDEMYFGTIKFANGEIYTGEWKDWMFDGKGKMVFANGDVYNGEWKEDAIQGSGRYEYSDGSVYVGDFVNGIREGYGKNTWPDGECYVGEFKDDVYHGNGKIVFADGETYVGEWFEGEIHGWGTYDYSDGTSYTGNWDHGEPIDGDSEDEDYDEELNSAYDNILKGLETISEGLSELSECLSTEDDEEYIDDEEEYVDDEEYNEEPEKPVLNGYHVVTDYRGTYEGEWKDGKRHGHGVLKEPNGDSYDGNWKNDEMYGYGKKVRRSATVTGGWKDYRNCGVVKTDYNDGGCKIEVYNKNGEKVGLTYNYNGPNSISRLDKSAEFWKDGNKVETSLIDLPIGIARGLEGSNYNYYGEIYETKTTRGPRGKGRALFRSGVVAAGNWDGHGNMTSGFILGKHYVKYGKFDEEMNLQGFGRVLMDDFYYEGNFVNGKYDGYGTFYRINGNEYNGIFKDNELVKLTKITYPSGETTSDELTLRLEEQLISVPYLVRD